jgi:hypothetical protein
LFSVQGLAQLVNEPVQKPVEPAQKPVEPFFQESANNFSDMVDWQTDRADNGRVNSAKTG